MRSRSCPCAVWCVVSRNRSSRCGYAAWPRRCFRSTKYSRHSSSMPSFIAMRPTPSARYQQGCPLRVIDLSMISSATKKYACMHVVLCICSLNCFAALATWHAKSKRKTVKCLDVVIIVVGYSVYNETSARKLMFARCSAATKPARTQWTIPQSLPVSAVLHLHLVRSS
jgi:hypothetical protein